MTEPTHTSQNRNFRLTQALYNTILTNLKVILGLFIVALVGWLFLYLMPLTEANSTYNANSHETALNLVVTNFVDVKKGKDMQINEAETATSSAQASCDFLDPKTQTANQPKITAINTALTELFNKHLLANKYQLDDKGLWQSACQQGETAKVNDDDMAFALKTLASPNKLMQLNWAERQKRPIQTRQNKPVGVATLPENWLTQTNPWYGLPGCVYISTPITKDNPTGYSYVEGGDKISPEMAQLCNHPKLVPQPVKTAMFQQPTTAKGQNSALSEVKNQATQALNQLNPTPNPAIRIKSTQDNHTALPANLGLMYSELSNIHSSHFDKQLLNAYEQYQQKKDPRNFWQKLTAPPLNAISLDGANVKIGYNMALTFDPNVQNTAQHVADCVTNKATGDTQTDCHAMLANLQGVTGQMYENALVRSIGIAVIDVKTQGILALASSESPCYAKDNGATDDTSVPYAPLQVTGCPLLWKKDWSGQNLLNHAMFQTVYPGSTVKTVQALALVRANPAFKNPETNDYRYLKQVLASSSTERVANFLFCQKTTSDMTLSRNAQGVCAGIPAYQKSAQDMGWSANCDKPSPFCGSKDLLFGLPYNSDPMLQSRYFSGVLLTDTKQNLKNLNFTAKQVNDCVVASNGRMSGSCAKGGDTLNEAMNEVFGAGNAKTSVVGVADSFMSLLLADNGQKQRRGSHIVQDLWGVNQIPLRPKAWRGDTNADTNATASTTATTNTANTSNNLATLPLNISQSDAHATLNLLSGTLLSGTGLGGGNGTAFSACTQAIGDCSWTNGVIVGKTGTPGFNFPTGQNGNRYYTPDVTTSMVQANCYNPEKPSFLCQNRPYKWFVYGIKDKNGKWDKAVAVLVERNWTKSGLVDDPHDGINRAVQAGMLLAKQIYKS